MLNSRWARVTALLLGAFTVTSALMFWATIFHSPRSYYDTSYDTYDFSDTGWSPGDGAYSANKLRNLESVGIQAIIDEITPELRQMETFRLLSLKNQDDMCIGENAIDCRGLDGNKIKGQI